MKSSIRLLLLSLVLVIVACGGGGGGPSIIPTAVLIYTTDWTNHAQAGGGTSQRLSILDLQGKVVKSAIANMSQAGSETFRIEGLTSGKYVFKAELFTQPNLGGIKSGEFQTVMDFMAETLFNSQVGVPVDSIMVTPNNEPIQVPKSQAFYALPKGTSGSATFAAPGTVSWSVLGGIGTINNQGILITGAPGNGTIRALHNPTSSLGSAIVQVAPATITTGKWTIFIFLNAANDLFSYSTLNVNQMETAAGNADVRFVVQWKQSVSKFSSSSFDGTRRVLVKPDNSDSVVSEVVQNLGSGIDMGRPQTMKAFLDWAKTYYPAERYGLIVWDHGNGWRRAPAGTRAVSYDDETGNAIQTWELKTGLAGHHFDFLAWDASLMQMTEVAYEVRDFADFIVGSEESPPAEGYPYQTIFPAFRDNPTAATRDLTKAFVDGMLGVPGYQSRKITQSVMESSKLPAVATALNDLGSELMANNVALHSAIQTARSQTQSYSQASSPPRYYRDLIDMCERLDSLSSIGSVDSACQALKAAAQAAIVWEGHNANSPGSRGISIDFTPGSIFINSATDYNLLKLGQDTLWDDWLVTAP